MFWNGTWLRRLRFGVIWLIDKDKSLWHIYGNNDGQRRRFEGRKLPGGLGTTDRDGKPRGASFAGLLN